MSKESIMLLPGLLCDERIWRDQVAALSGRFDCRVPDYGSCDSITAMAERVLHEASTECFSVIGHSMGGRVALEMLRLAPQRVVRLALLDSGIDPKAPGVAGADEEAKRNALVVLAQRNGMRAMGMQWARGMVHPSRLDTPLFDEIIAMIERKSLAVYEGQIRALLNRPNGRPVLAGAPRPTLLLCGRQDAWSPLGRHEEMQRLLPGSRLTVIEESGHMATMEQPDAVNTSLLDWLGA
jgi:pimeloyl-ACP methyl ester carboxylesterase